MACWTAWARNWKAVADQSSVLSLRLHPKFYIVPDGTSEDARAYIERPTTDDRRLLYGLTAIKSGLQVNVTPLHNPACSVVASVVNEICWMSPPLCVSRMCT